MFVKFEVFLRGSEAESEMVLLRGFLVRVSCVPLGLGLTDQGKLLGGELWVLGERSALAIHEVHEFRTTFVP